MNCFGKDYENGKILNVGASAVLTEDDKRRINLWKNLL